MKSEKTCSNYVILILSVLLFTACNTDQTIESPTKVAVMLDLEGNQSTLGQQAMNGFLLGIQQASYKDSSKIFVSLVNTQSDKSVTRVAAQQLASEVSLGAGFTDNNSVLASGEFFQEANVPFLSIGATDPTLPETFGGDIFLVPFGDNAQAAAGAEFAFEKFGNSSVILWDSTSQYTRSLPQYFESRFEQLGGNVFLNLSFDGNCDLSSLAKQVLDLPSMPAFIYLAGLPNCIGDVVASIRSAGLNIPIVGADGFDTPNLLEKKVSDVWYTTHAWLSKDNPNTEIQQFVERYTRAYGVEPKDAFAALGYDVANLMVDVLKRAGSSDPELIFNELESTEGFNGVTGTISYDKESHVPKKTVWLIQVTDGQRSLADHFIPKVVPPPILGNNRQEIESPL